MDFEAVIGWLECISQGEWEMYICDSDLQRIAKYALELLKEQQEKIEQFQRTIEAMPKPVKLLDVFGEYEKVVRCNDCKHGFVCENDVRCENKNAPAMIGQHHSFDWFCADGKPIENIQD